MKKAAFSFLSILIAGCGSISNKRMDLPPLPDTEPVQVYYSKPNIKYDEVCDIEVRNSVLLPSSTSKEDFEEKFKDEARKCGANSVIVGFSISYPGGAEKRFGTGIRIKSQAAALTGEDKVKAFSLAIQTHDLLKLSEILAPVPKHKSERAPTDDQMVDLGLYIALLDGLECDSKIVGLLEKNYEAVVPKFGAITLAGKSDSNVPLCNDVMARALEKMRDATDAVRETNNHYVRQLKSSYEKDFEKRVSKYNELLKAAARVIANACMRSGTEPTCVMKNGFLSFSNQTKNSKSASVRKNAVDVLKILNP